MACGRLSQVLEGPHQGLVIDGPEYETIYSFGALCMIESIEEITYLNDLCDRLGLDTISAGNLCAFAIEAARRGRIKADLDYNQPQAVARLVEDIALRRGLGEVLSQGIRPASQAWGLEDLAVHVKGMEPAGYDPRVFKGMGLAYGVSDRGACHQRSTFFKLELSGISPPEQMEGKAAHFVEWEDRHTLMDTFVFCRFYRDFYPIEEMATILRGLTGQDLSLADLRAIAKNVTDDTRRFNLREGLRPEQDHLPERIYQEALPETGAAITRADMTLMLDDYYRLRGWDQAGSPQP
jgi:aldehyde:ferredoxin oxidoreductase